MNFKMNSRATLNDGHLIPWLGLGVFQSPSGKATFESVSFALKSGYRHVDTAHIYGNETDVGEAIKASGIPRSEIFITTKLWNADQGFEKAQRAFELSLKKLKLEYIDLYLIHFPMEPKLRKESWRALVEIKKSGRIRSIGVSNYTIRHLEELLSESDVTPAVNQVEFSPFLFQKELLDFCQKHQIQLEAYSPLTKGRRLKDGTLVEIAKKHKKTPAQILIRWCLEHKVVVIPKSNHVERISENAAVFDFALDKDDLRAMDALNEDFRTSWDPSDVP